MATPVGRPATGLLDTSVFIATETGRPLGDLPDTPAVSVVTVAELQLGVLMADDLGVRAARSRTLRRLEELFAPLSIDRSVAGVFAELAAEARRLGRRPGILDALIAATAVAHGLPVYTQDDDFFRIPRVHVVRV
ncbi:MAG: PIN domain-containing protein [Dehalococcoidia bacterium]|nr:PIN domain-containing protein [Dehalococcoidia bacterium]